MYVVSFNLSNMKIMLSIFQLPNYIRKKRYEGLNIG